MPDFEATGADDPRPLKTLSLRQAQVFVSRRTVILLAGLGTAATGLWNALLRQFLTVPVS